MESHLCRVLAGLLLLTFGIPTCTPANVKTDETRLIDNIMHNYNPAARPVYNASHTVVVKFGITLTQISDMVSPFCILLIVWPYFCSWTSSETAQPPRPVVPTDRGSNPVIEGRVTSFQNNPEKRHRRSADGVPRPVPDEQVLMEELLTNYHRYSRPVINASLSVVVKFGITLVQISDMVSKGRQPSWSDVVWFIKRGPILLNNFKRMLKIFCFLKLTLMQKKNYFLNCNITKVDLNKTDQ